MIQLCASLGAIIAGLAMLLTQGLPLLAARRSGVLISKAYGAPRIERAADPERFETLFRQRRNALGLPLILIGVGAVFLVQFVMFLAAATPGG